MGCRACDAVGSVLYVLPSRMQCSVVPAYRKAAQDQQQQQARQEDAKTSPSPENINPNQQVPDKSAAERERQRLREQERRRREAVSEECFILCMCGALFLLPDRQLLWASDPLFLIFFLFFQMAGQIDMNMQSDLMAAFEESL